MILQPGGLPTKVVCLTNCVNPDELRDDEEFEDILEDMRQEGGKFGTSFITCTLWFICGSPVGIVTSLS